MKSFEVIGYNYSELSKGARQNAKERLSYNEAFIDSCHMKVHEDFIIDVCNEIFPTSDLKLEYDFSCCQGSGLNIYGDLSITDILNLFDDNFTKEEIQHFKDMFCHRDYIIIPHHTDRYTCSLAYSIDVFGYDVECINKQDEELLYHLNGLISRAIHTLNKDLYNQYIGYFEVTEETAELFYEDVYFDKNGNELNIF